MRTALDESRDGLLVLLVRRQPARVPFGFLDRFQHVVADPFDEVAWSAQSVGIRVLNHFFDGRGVDNCAGQIPTRAW